VSQIASNVGKELIGLPAQMIPMGTFLYQIRKMSDNTRRIYTNPDPFTEAVNRALYRLPYYSRSLPKAYKTLGINMPSELYRNGENNLFNIFFNPGFQAEYTTDPLIEALLAPLEEEGETRQFPRTVGAKYRVLGQTLELQPEDRSEMQRMLANATTRNFRALLAQGAFRGIDAGEQTKRFVNGWSKKGRDKLPGLNAAAADVKEWFIKNRIKGYMEGLSPRAKKELRAKLKRR